MKSLNEFNENDVIGQCANRDCSNEITREDEYLVDDQNLYCDSICYTKCMVMTGVVKEIK